MTKQHRLVAGAKLFVFGACSLFMAGCGTVSNLNSPGTTKLPDLITYDSIVVKDFENMIAASTTAKPEYQHAVNFALRDFPDKIAKRLEANQVFKSVSRQDNGVAGPLTLSGQITQYDEGSAMARLFIGMGAGSSYFDATVQLRDANNVLLGTIQVDKNSWILGGGIASGQTVDTFMEEAAQKVVQQLAEAKGIKLTKVKSAPRLGTEFPADETKTLAWLTCKRPYTLTQDCSGFSGAKKKVVIADFTLKIAGSQDGHDVLIMGPDASNTSSEKFLKVMDEIKKALNNASIKIVKTMKYTTFGRVAAVTLELDGDGYSVLSQYADNK